MVAVTQPKQPATIADLDRTPDDGRRYELIDGEIVVSAAPTWAHQYALRSTFRLVDEWTQRLSLGEAMVAPFDIVLSPTRVVEPDVFVLPSDVDAHLRADGRYDGVPLLVVEVLSPTNRTHDTVTKLYHYARAGIAEYWQVDPIARTVDILRLDDGQYVPQEIDEAGRVASVVIPGLVVDPTTLFLPVGPA
ncbi:MAG TPA: Uma2 family endonuclease [Thermomicrobiales bacterium]|jgi:Uma2 family endonuclease|nr:Uma2 family endonuclease [Thermomicrobiales bacterium]